MSGFDVLSSTLRSGTEIDEVEFVVPGMPPATAYFVGRRLEPPQPVVLALHDERGDKATLLDDLELLAARGFLGLAIDCPATRAAIGERDHLRALERQVHVGTTALNLLQGDPDTVDHPVSLLGRGIGAEAAAVIAAHTFNVRAVVAIAPVIDRCRFLSTSPHPLAAGLRQYRTGRDLPSQFDGLARHRLLPQIDAAEMTHWLVQVADDDDRPDDQDRHDLTFSLRPTARVEHYPTARDLRASTAVRNRVRFLSDLGR